jgi:hypothetical protein
MPPRARQIPPLPEPEPEVQEPPYYIATDYLREGGIEGVGSVIVFSPGDKVLPHYVAPNRWGDKVVVPDVFKGILEPPPRPEDQHEDQPATGEASE